MYENDNSKSVEQKITLGRQLYPSYPQNESTGPPPQPSPNALPLLKLYPRTNHRNTENCTVKGWIPPPPPSHNKRFIIIFIKTFLNGSNLYNRWHERNDYLITAWKRIVLHHFFLCHKGDKLENLMNFFFCNWYINAKKLPASKKMHRPKCW